MDCLSDQYEHYRRSIASSREWLNATSEALDELVNIFEEAYRRGINVYEGLSHAEPVALARSFDHYFDSTLEKLNARCGHEYLFAGSKSTVQPFVIASGWPLQPDAAGVAYVGKTTDPLGVPGNRTRHIAPETKVDIAINGEQLWRFSTGNKNNSSSTLTETLHELSNAIRGGNRVALSGALDRIGAALDHIKKCASRLMEISRQLDLISEHLDETITQLEECLCDP